jgi:undecaprenyl-diphosphatase
MDPFQLVVLSLVQGLTEFLPVSSSAHLILLPLLTGWQDQGLTMDVAAHVGTLLAVLCYFHRQLWHLARAWCLSVARRELTADARLAWGILIATVPAGLAGLLLHDYVETHFRNPLVIAGATCVFGLLLLLADLYGRKHGEEHRLGWTAMVLIGCAQALALVPGTSRSGITMTAGLFAGLSRVACARFSFYLSVPLIAAAGLLETGKLLKSAAPVDWLALGTVVGLTFLTALLAIHFLMRLLLHMGMWPFVVYRFALGAYLFTRFF